MSDDEVFGSLKQEHGLRRAISSSDNKVAVCVQSAQDKGGKKPLVLLKNLVRVYVDAITYGLNKVDYVVCHPFHIAKQPPR